ncbi:MAG TPA: ABC transporter permease [Candidatus Avidehalobacter gallistercoris]|uniref:ABC transporter permease n=1 Tax=Candidatus Avidehalobacter gallistercoris TaxID=2840694 RepID=A0A9D1KY11_9FIRM|nr:ABC transporter permease [Candidatus Avidehalobacter gallistercoris]
MTAEQIFEILSTETVNTLILTLFSTLLAYVIGLPLGIVLIITDKDGIHPNRPLNAVLGFIVNILRSIPFLILMVWMVPVTRTIVGTTIGNRGTILPLVVAAAPFVARMVESSIKEVDHGVIEAAQSMGAPTSKIITKVMLGEALPSLLIGFAITITTILGYTAMAGFAGGGGLGKVAVNYGFYKYQDDIMTFSVILLVILVQIFQETGMRLSKRFDKRL